MEYADSSVTDVAISGLNNMMLGEKALKVQKASIGITQVAGELSVNAMSMLAGTTPSDNDAGRVLQLLNMVTADELMDNDDYEGLSLLLLCIITLWVANVMNQKFVMMYKRSARSLARSSPSRFLGRSVAADSQPAWARSSSSSRTMKLPTRLFGLWPGGSSLTGLW